MVEALFVALFENVAETLGGDEGGGGALAFDERVGGQGGAVDEDADIPEAQAGLAQHQFDAFDDAQFRRAGGGEYLAAPAVQPGFEYDVSESTANIGGEFDVFGHG